MRKQFKREQRYFVVKVKDAKEYLDAHQLEKLAEIADTISEGREKDGILAVDCVVVEADWPEYEPTWKAIEARVTGIQPAPSFADAYQGAMEEVAIWKRRALEAEDLNRKFVAEINGPAYMGEPAQPAPSVPDDMIERAVTRFLSWKLPKDFHPDGGVVFIPTKGRGYDSPHWPCGTNLLNAQQARDMLRHVLAAAPEAKP